jgi:hypothetical protein
MLTQDAHQLNFLIHLYGKPFTIAQAFYLRGRFRQHLAEDDPIDLTSGIRDFLVAMILTDLKADPKLFYTAVSALCETIPFGLCTDEELALALKRLTQHFPSPGPGRPPVIVPPETAWHRWLRALLLQRFGAVRRAERLLVGCRNCFAYWRRLPEYLVLSLDLGEIYLTESRGPELQTLAADMVFCFRALESLPARGAVLTWRDMLLHGDLTRERHLGIRRQMSAWLRDDLVKRRLVPDYNGPKFFEPPKGGRS